MNNVSNGFIRIVQPGAPLTTGGTAAARRVMIGLKDESFASLTADRKPPFRAAAVKALVDRLEAEGVGYDLGAHRDAPPGLRLWGGATVGGDDLAALLPWLDWAYATVRGERRAA